MHASPILPAITKRHTVQELSRQPSDNLFIWRSCQIGFTGARIIIKANGNQPGKEPDNERNVSAEPDHEPGPGRSVPPGQPRWNGRKPDDGQPWQPTVRR